MSYLPVPPYECKTVDAFLGCNPVEGSSNLFGNNSYSHYGYNVNKATAIVFTVLFGLSCLLHLALTFVFRGKRNMPGLVWWLIPTLVVGTFAETLGWIGRALSAYTVRWYPYEGGVWDSMDEGFMIQICCLIIAPAFFAAWNYILLGELILRTSYRENGTIRSYSTFHPRGYTVVFVTGDISSLVVQALGGGIAASATTLSGANAGANIMVGGIVIQLAVMVLYSLVLLEFAVRYITRRPAPRMINLIGCCCFRWARAEPKVRSHAPPTKEASGADSPPDSAPAAEPYTGRNKNIKYLLSLCSFTTLLLFIRSIFRSIELLNGWTGPIVENEGLFDGLDAAMMIILVWFYLIFHPGWFL